MTGESRVGINGTLVHSDPSGLGVYSQELLLELLATKSQFDFIVYTSSDSLIKSFPRKVSPASPLTSPDRRFLGNILRILWQQTVLPLRLRKQRASLVYSPVPEGIFYPHLSQIITIHDVIPFKYPELYPKQKYHFYYAVPILLMHSQAVICDSENTKKDAIAYYRVDDERMHVIYPGFNPERFWPRPNGPVPRRFGLTRYLLYVGDMRPYKNLERILEAFASLRLKDLQFVIAGRKDRRFYPRIRKKVGDLSLEDKVVFLGYVPEEDLPHLYSASAALVHATLYEGFGLPPLEAMACGCPVIASNVASLPEVCGDAAYYVDPYDAGSIAAGIHQVLTDHNLRNALVRKGLERVQLFSWRKTVEQLIKLFEKVMGGQAKDG
jgi:glycosyltransferase involved in cell wall biosynthesis